MKYGKKTLGINVPSDNVISILKPKSMPIANEDDAIRSALKHPLGRETLTNMVKKGMKIALLVSDITRPCPSYKILPHLVHELNKSGVEDDDIIVFFANGMHRKLTAQEMARLVGSEMFRRIKTVNHDSKNKANLEYVGRTRRGTYVHINKGVLNCDFIIGVANIDIHYFAGYSGGGKSMLPGVASFETIRQNHSLMLLKGAEPGKIDGNPVREDLEEGARMAGMDYIVNVVLNENKKIVEAVAGDFIEAHRAGVKTIDFMYKIPIDQKADIVIASAGGFPKDINLYQAQKALENASYAVKDGGTIILLAECNEGFGEETFKTWLIEASCPDDIIARLEEGFVLGGHKAFAIARVAKRARILLFSNPSFQKIINKNIAKKGLMKPINNIEEALKTLLNTYGKDTSIIVMPYAGSTLPSPK